MSEKSASAGLPLDDRQDLTTGEAAHHLAMSGQAVRRAIVRGQLPARKQGRSYRISLPALRRYQALRQHQVRGNWTGGGNAMAGAPRSLPTPLTPFIGRACEVQAICELIQSGEARLVTMTGPGGVGKSRLALACASELQGCFPQRAVFVDFADVAHGDLVSATISQALDLREPGDRPVLDYLITYLRGRQTLLILDNLEHLRPAGRQIARLLEVCPGLVVLATSRIALHVSGEHVYQVQPFAAPAVGASAAGWTAADIERSAAGRLFTLRARAARASFAVTPANAPVIAEVCCRLDGLPLAIELAAARCAALTPEALLARMDQPLPLLTAGPRDAPARRQSLGAAIAWSYSLLSLPEQHAFRWLAVFAGGFTLEAAESLLGALLVELPADDAAAPVRPFDMVMSLHAQSLLTRQEQADGTVRFRMLETIRAYALDQLQQHGEESRTRCHWAAQLLARVELAERVVPRPDRWWIPFEAEWANLRAALQWTIDAGQTALGLQLGAELFGYWMLRGQIGEGISWLEQVAAAGEDEPGLLRARAMIALGFLHWIAGNLDRADALAVAALRLGHEAGDGVTSAVTTFLQGFIAETRGDLAEALRLLTMTRVQYEAAAVPSAAAAVQGHAGRVLLRLGDPAAARDALTAALAGLDREEGGHWGAALALTDYGLLLAYDGDLPHAAASIARGLAVHQAIGDHLTTVISLATAAYALAVAGSPAAGSLLEAIVPLREQCGPAMWAVAAAAFADAERLLPPADSVAAQGADCRDQSGDIVAFALAALASVAQPTTPLAATSAAPRLSPRELEVLRLIATGQTDREAAAALGLDVRTVNTYVANARRKLGAPSRAAAVAALMQLRLA